MITGDHPVTAQAVARELGLLEHAAASSPAPSWRRMSDAELEREVEHDRGLRPRLAGAQAARRHGAAEAAATSWR